MKKITAILLFIALSFSLLSFSQPGAINPSAIRSRVADSTTVMYPTGWGVLYYNAQSAKWRICDGAGVCQDVDQANIGTITTRNNLPPSVHTSSFTLVPGDTSKMHIMRGGSGAAVITLGTFSGLTGKGLQFPFIRDRVDTVYFDDGSETLKMLSGNAGIADSTITYLYYDGTADAFYLANGGGSVGLTSVNWGEINGLLSDQTDLQDALNGKQDDLGYVPLNPANNLSDVSTPATGLINLGGLQATTTFNTQTGNYTLQVSDFAVNTTILMNSSSNRVLTLPTDVTAAIPIGKTVLGRRIGSASITFTPEGGASVTSAGGSANDPGRYYLWAITKTSANSFYLDNGGAALGTPNQILGVDNAGTAQEYKTVSNGLTASSGSVVLGGALTANTNLSGAFSVGLGATPSAKLHVQGLGGGEILRLTDNTPTTRLTITDPGILTHTAAVSGTATAFQSNLTMTSTANSQTHTYHDFVTTSVPGAFTSLTQIFWRIRNTNVAAGDFMNITGTSMIFNGVTLYDFRNATSQAVIRNSASTLAVRGGSGTSTGLTLGVNNASSTNNNVAVAFTGNYHDIIAGALTRTWTGILNDVSVSAGNGNTINYTMWNKINSYSLGNCTATIVDEDYNPTITGSGTITHIAKRIRSGLSGFGVGSTLPTALVTLGAGTTAANSAPLKFTSGSLQTTAEVGAVEFLTDRFYGTITTGSARKEITLNDAALTSGTFPVATTNGRLTDSGLTTSNLKAIYSNGFSGAGTATTTFTVTIGATLGATTYEVVVSPSNALSAALFYVNNKTTTTFDVVYLAGLTGTVAFDWIVTP